MLKAQREGKLGEYLREDMIKLGITAQALG